MTILHVTDLHFEKRWFHWLLDQAPPHDLLVVSGDLLDLSSPTPQRKQIGWVLDWLNACPGPVSLCSGNHDLEWYDAAERWTPAYWLRDRANPLVWSDGQQLTFDGLTLLNVGCTTRPKGGAADVWVVHAPPTGTLVSTRNIGLEGGDPALVGAVRRYTPRLVLSGHVHHPVQWHDASDATLYLNPGRHDGAAFPNHILVDPTTLACQLHTVDGVDSIGYARVAAEPDASPEPQVLTPAA
jgi:Icc-related predicted phosphoesterase